MYKILKAEKLSENIFLMDVHAPRVASHCEPGQFVIVKMDEKGERIPLTICDYDREAGTITIVVQEVGASTVKMLSLIHILWMQESRCIMHSVWQVWHSPMHCLESYTLWHIRQVQHSQQDTFLTDVRMRFIFHM